MISTRLAKGRANTWRHVIRQLLHIGMQSSGHLFANYTEACVFVIQIYCERIWVNNITELVINFISFIKL